jgi:hypothetical protein
MKTKSPQFTAHVNQIADDTNCLRVDNTEIKGRISKNGKFFIAESAVEYTIEEVENDTVEGEEIVPLFDALSEWLSPIGSVKLIDGMIPVLCSDKVWRPLVWVDENGHGKSFVRG